jgi:hypothetical protein
VPAKGVHGPGNQALDDKTVEARGNDGQTHALDYEIALDGVD